MFIGEFHHSIDDKGRLAIPVKFRSAFKSGAVVTRGLDKSLFLYTNQEWKKYAVKLANLPISQSKSRAFARLMLAGAMDVALDKQGRIVLPDYLRAYSTLNKKAVVAGLGDRVEIWSEEEWERYKLQTESSSNDIAEALGELGV